MMSAAEPWIGAVSHIRCYDRRRLEQIAALSGLTLGAAKPFNVLGIPGWWWNGVRGARFAPGAQIAKFYRLIPLLAGIERILHPPTGLALIAQLIKP